MTTWECVSPNTTISIVAASLVLLLVSYGLMDRKHSQGRRPAVTHKDVPYTPLDDTTEPCADHVNLTWRQKLASIRQVWPVAASVIVAWIAEYLVIQSVVTTLAFPSAPFPPRDHYQYYVFIFLFGELFGRSYLTVVSFVKHSLVEKAICSWIWFPAMAEVIIFVFLTLEAWFRFFHDIWSMLLLIYVAGLICGAIYTNMLALYSRIEDSNTREFVLGYAMVATGAGATTAAFLGLAVEPWLLNHCLSVLKQGDFCYTRNMNGDICIYN